MDMYLSAQDSFNLQEMLDCDIKCEVDDSFGFDCTLPPLDFEEDSAHVWIQGNSNSSFELDFFGNDSTATLMVNPHSIMPLASLQRKREVEVVKVEAKSEPPSPLPPDCSEPEEPSPPPSPKMLLTRTPQSIRVVATSLLVKSTTPSASTTTTTTMTSTSNSSNNNNNNNATPISSVKIDTPSLITVTTNSKVRKSAMSSSRKQLCLSESVYPKPAYSYSCLIAMALKNSRSGSLPVSEIYNFMCEHFPYFRTAPNGWKNSVRHNLSLNKCFEKIEKPVTGPGGTQRKGCLWAMNPDKAAKMDDEVAKWSRKDPHAIKKAMLTPENLERLERGEMKVGRAPGDSDDEEEDAAEEETEEDEYAEVRRRLHQHGQSAAASSAREEEEDDGEDEEDEEEEEEEEEEEDDDEPQPIGSDESEDELSRMPPSLQPFEPRLAHRFGDSSDLRLPANGLSDIGIEISQELDVGYDDLDIAESLLGIDMSVPAYADDSEEESEYETNFLASSVSSGRRKRTAAAARIQGNYVCVKRRVPPQNCRLIK